MKKKASGRSSLLLMELILSILFFALASAVCLQIFVKASLIGKDTKELDQAVRCVTSAAELLGQAEEPMKQIMEQYPNSFVLSGENPLDISCSDTQTALSDGPPRCKSRGRPCAPILQ